MNWSDERYVRLFTRDTATWKRWDWEARACFGLLLRKVDRAGVLDTGTADKIESMALLLEIPIAVAQRVVPQWLRSGTVTESPAAFVLPTFIEAQEAKQTDAARQRTSRENRRAATLQNKDGACHTVSQPVTSSHTESQPVTPAVPSRAVPSRAELLPTVEKPTVAKGKSSRVATPDPRHASLVKALCEAFEAQRGSKYPFTPRDAAAVKGLLQTGSTPEVLVEAWRRALAHQGYPAVSCLSELLGHLAHFVGAAPPASSRPATAPVPDWTNAEAGELPW